jgi:hypothetical protein
LDSVDEELFFQSALQLLEMSNNIGSNNVSTIIVKRIVTDLRTLWREVLSEEDKQLLRDYGRSERPLYFIKNKLSASQVAQLLNEVTKDTCPFQKAVPPYILVTMETVAKTSQFVGWISDASTAWIPSWPATDSKKPKRAAVAKSPVAKPAFKETAKAPLKRGNSIFQIAPVEPQPETQQPTRPALQRQKTVGIDMFPILSGTVSQTGVNMGPPPKPKKRIAFKVHNQSVWNRLFHF